MGWGINFKTNIYLSRQNFSNKFEVINKIKGNDEIIKKHEDIFKMFASSTPKNIIPDDWNEQPIDWLNNSITDELINYNELIIENYNLSLYLNYLIENNINEIKSECDENLLDKNRPDID